MGIRGEYRFSSFVKQKKKRKITLSFTSPGKDFFFYIYDVITWGKKKAVLIPTNHRPQRPAVSQ